jgi:hypothetical protein
MIGYITLGALLVCLACNLATIGIDVVRRGRRDKASYAEAVRRARAERGTANG